MQDNLRAIVPQPVVSYQVVMILVFAKIALTRVFGLVRIRTYFVIDWELGYGFGAANLRPMSGV